jgi:hypothetical protein
MQGFIRVLLVSIFAVLPACEGTSSDQTGPVISDIKTSGNVLVISDCPSTSVKVSANASDPSGIKSVLLWYRIPPDEKFTSAPMEFQDGSYVVSLNGVDFLGHAYGTIEFYISAQDAVGNMSQSAIDQSIQFLPCVSN